MTAQSALLVMDLINDVVHPDGAFASHGYAAQVDSRGVLHAAAEAIARARAEDTPVVYVVVGFSADYAQWPAGSPVFADTKQHRKLLLDSWATQVHDLVKPEPDDQVIVKHRLSPFFGTPLELLLRTRGVSHLTLTGVSTDLVVLSTAREAHDRDFAVTVLADATAAPTRELHEAALTVLARTATVR